MRDVSTPLDMTRRPFNAVHVYHDFASRSAAMNMAIDEALLETAKVPSIRFYRWQSPALSFGYFGKFTDVANHAVERDLVRRWTGGGVVFHGEDLTYAIVIPPSDPVLSESSRSLYAAIHAALRNALVASGERAELAPAADVAAILDRGYNCFANPVRADVMLNGRKIAGGSTAAHQARFASARQHPVCRSWEWFIGTIRAGVISELQRGRDQSRDFRPGAGTGGAKVRS